MKINLEFLNSLEKFRSLSVFLSGIPGSGRCADQVTVPKFHQSGPANFGPPTERGNEHCAPPEIGRISCLVVLKYVLALYSKQA